MNSSSHVKTYASQLICFVLCLSRTYQDPLLLLGRDGVGPGQCVLSRGRALVRRAARRAEVAAGAAAAAEDEAVIVGEESGDDVFLRLTKRRKRY